MKCTFCESEIEKGKGMMFVKRDGRLEYFCSSKCRKNMHKLGRNPRYFKWTEKGQKANKGTVAVKGKEKTTKTEKKAK